MAKLSRTNKFQELRDQLDEETTQAQSLEQPIKLSRASKSQGNVTDSTIHALDPQKTRQPELEIHQSAVIDELVDEVKQYNIDKGDRAAEDTQINILRSLDEDAALLQKRIAHMETMESNTDAGGTTMNINAMSIESVITNALQATQEQPAPLQVDVSSALEEEAALDEPLVLGKKELFADETATQDNLEMFDLGVDDFDQTIRQNNAPKPAAKKRAAPSPEPAPAPAPAPVAAPKPAPVKKAKPVYSQPVHQEEEEEESSGSKVGNILMILLIVVLLGCIAYTIYLISKIGIF